MNAGIMRISTNGYNMIVAYDGNVARFLVDSMFCNTSRIPLESIECFDGWEEKEIASDEFDRFFGLSGIPGDKAEIVEAIWEVAS